MTHHKWDLKSNYMLAFAVDKHGIEHHQWTRIAEKLSDFIQTTPENCQIQFDHLCRQYGQDWSSESGEALHAYIFSVIKHLYYTDLCERMSESRNLLMVMYDFIRLYNGGRLTLEDVNEILQDLRSSTTNLTEGPERERQEKIRLLQRLKSLLAKKVPDASNPQESYSFPMELLPPPPFYSSMTKYDFSGPSTTTNTDYFHPMAPINDPPISAVPSTFNMASTVPSYATAMAQRTEPSSSTTNAPNEADVDEIELSSDDENDRTMKEVQDTNISQASADSNLALGHDESNNISNELMETNESSNVPPMTNDPSTSDEEDLEDNISNVSISNQSTVDTRLSTNEQAVSNINSELPGSSSVQANPSVSDSNDHITLDSAPLASAQDQECTETESLVPATSRVVAIEDDDIARMDAEQTPEHVPVDVEDIPVPNDNAVFVVEELVPAHPNLAAVTSATLERSEAAASDTGVLTEIQANDESPAKRRKLDNASQSNQGPSSQNFRKSVNAILNNLKNAKYGPDFSKSLKSFKLQEDYYIRIKKPLDIPEIRQRMINGDYDDNILLFERDVLLMLTNALSNYHRDNDIHGHAREMMDYALELFTPLEATHTPWKVSNGYGTHDDHDVRSSSIYFDNGHDSDDVQSRQRTPSVASTSSSVRTNTSTKHNRSQASSTHTMQRRQRKTVHSF